MLHSTLEPVQFIGDGQYNLNALKEIVVTDSYLGLPQDTIRCQSNEPLDNCTTRQYRDSILGMCGCLPAVLRTENKVKLLKI